MIFIRKISRSSLNLLSVKKSVMSGWEYCVQKNLSLGDTSIYPRHGVPTLKPIGINIKCIYVSLIYKFVVLLCYITYVTILCYTVNKVVFEFEFEI